MFLGATESHTLRSSLSVSSPLNTYLYGGEFCISNPRRAQAIPLLRRISSGEIPLLAVAAEHYGSFMGHNGYRTTGNIYDGIHR